MNTSQMSKIDAALARAKAGTSTVATTTAQRVTASLEKDKEREQRRQQQAAVAEERRALRQAEKEKRAKELAEAKQTQVSKLDRVAETLPVLSDKGKEILANIVQELSPEDQTTLVAHLQFALRKSAATAAKSVSHKIGQEVRIVGGMYPKYIGQQGTVVRVQRVRCFVKVGQKEIYLYNTECVPIQAVTNNSAVEEKHEETEAEETFVSAAALSEASVAE